jgi:hypothetical protein
VNWKGMGKKQSRPGLYPRICLRETEVNHKSFRPDSYALAKIQQSYSKKKFFLVKLSANAL